MSSGSKPTPACIARLNKELQQLEHEPPPGISAWPKDGQINVLEALIQGPAGTPYEGGTFKLEVNVPDRYPFEPPKIRFITPIYHPNIDSGGRICLDTLNMPPKGQWKPAVNLSTVLSTIALLMAEPNPDDGLMADITNEYRSNRAAFEATARARTQLHAVDGANATLQHQRSGEAEPAPAGGSGRGGHDQPAGGGGGAQDPESEESEEDEEELSAMWGGAAAPATKAGAVAAQSTAINPETDAVLDSDGEEDEDALFTHPIASSSPAQLASPSKGVPLANKNTSPKKGAAPGKRGSPASQAPAAGISPTKRARLSR